MLNRLPQLVREIFTGLADDPQIVAAAPPVPIRILFQRFWPYVRPYRGWLGLTLVLVALTPALDTATIWLFKLLVDQVLVPQTFGPFPWLVAAYFGLMLAGGIVSFASDYVSAWVSGRFLLDLRTSVFQHLQRLSLDFFDRRQLGDVLSRLASDIGAIESLVLSGVADTVKYVLRLIFFVGALVYLAWDLALLALDIITI